MNNVLSLQTMAPDATTAAVARWTLLSIDCNPEHSTFSVGCY